MSIKVSVILVNYNTKVLTNNCIDSIVKNTSGVTYEIILVDNNSSDGSVAMFCNDSRIVFVKNEDNSGFGVGNNIGASYSQGKYLFFLNTDTLLQNNAIKFFYDYCENSTTEKLGVVGCWLKDRNGNITTSFVSFQSVFSSWKHVWHFVRKKIVVRHNDISDSKLYVDAVSGADIFMSRNLFFSVGCFDSDYFMYSEESELQYRIKKLGLKNVLIPEPSIIHLEGSSSGKTSEKSSYFQLYSMKRGRFLFYRKHKPFFISFIVALLDFPVDWIFSMDKRFAHKRKKYFQLYSILIPWCKINKQITQKEFYL